MSSGTRVDARRLNAAAQQQLRMEVVRQSAEGSSPEEIAARTGLDRRTVASVLKKYAAGGEGALRGSARGRKPGGNMALTPEQQTAVRDEMRRHAPRACEVDTPLPGHTWTWSQVQALIHLKFGIELTRPGTLQYLARWGIKLEGTNRRPEGRAATAIQAWWREHAGALEEDARRHRAAIVWLNPPLDLTPASSWYSSRLERPAKTLRLLSAVAPGGTLHWMIFTGKFTTQIQAGFIFRLRRDVAPRLRLIRTSLDIYSGDAFLEWAGREAATVAVYPPAGLTSLSLLAPRFAS